MPKPFDSKVEIRRDDDVPFLEFEYKQSRMTQGQQAAAVLSVAMVFTAPLLPIPLILRRRPHRVRLDATGIRVSVRRFGKWRDDFFPREHVQRLRTHKIMVNGPVMQVLFDFGIKSRVLLDGLSEPELLWMYDEIQAFISRHWGGIREDRL